MGNGRGRKILDRCRGGYWVQLLQTFGDCREVFDLCVMTGFLSLSSKGVICIEAACAFINGNIVTQSFLVVQGD